MNLDAVHADVVVGNHDVERVGDLADLTAVVHVVRLHLPAVNHEVDVGSTMQVAHWLVRTRLHVGQGNQLQRVERLWLRLQMHQWGGVVGKQVATAAEVFLDLKRVVVHPVFVWHLGGVAHRLLAAIAAAGLQWVWVVHCLVAAQVHHMLVVAVDEQRTETCHFLAFVRAEDRAERYRLAVAHVEAVHVHQHRQSHHLACVRQRGTLNRGFATKHIGGRTFWLTGVAGVLGQQAWLRSHAALLHTVVDVVDQVQRNLRRTEIVVMAVVELPATLSTWILAVFQVVITHGNLGLHTEMTAHRPLVAITEATTHIPAFIAVVVETRGDAERKVHVSGVELTAHQVEGDERTIHALAEVTAQLRLQQPMTDLLITIEIPWIQTKTDVGGPMA